MPMPFADVHAEPAPPEGQHVPEVVPIDELTAESIEAAEAEIEAEEAWRRTV